jgi:hypothetical protein
MILPNVASGPWLHVTAPGPLAGPRVGKTRSSRPPRICEGRRRTTEEHNAILLTWGGDRFSLLLSPTNLSFNTSLCSVGCSIPSECHLPDWFHSLLSHYPILQPRSSHFQENGGNNPYSPFSLWRVAALRILRGSRFCQLSVAPLRLRIACLARTKVKLRALEPAT